MAAGELPPSRQCVLEVAAPSRWVLTGSPTPDLGEVEHALDPTAYSRSGLRLRLPYRCENLEHVLGADLVDMLGAKRTAILVAERHPPLGGVFGVAPTAVERLHQGVGGLAERLLLSLSGGKWITAVG